MALGSTTAAAVRPATMSKRTAPESAACAAAVVGVSLMLRRRDDHCFSSFRGPGTFAPLLGRRLSPHLLADDFRHDFPAVRFEKRVRVDARKEIHERSDEAGPSGLMARAEPGAVVALEILVEQDEVTP